MYLIVDAWALTVPWEKTSKNNGASFNLASNTPVSPVYYSIGPSSEMYFGISGLTLEYGMEPSLTIGGLGRANYVARTENKKCLCPSKIGRQNQSLGNENIQMMMMIMITLTSNEDDEDCICEVSG